MGVYPIANLKNKTNVFSALFDRCQTKALKVFLTMIKLLPNNYNKTTMAIKSDNRTVDTNFDSESDRVILIIEHRIPITAKFIFEQNITAITKSYHIERFDCWFGIPKSPNTNNIGFLFEKSKMKDPNKEGISIFSTNVAQNQGGWYSNYDTGVSQSNSTGIRAYGFDIPNRTVYFYRNGIQQFAVNLPTKIPNYVEKILNAKFCYVGIPSFSGNIFTATYNLGESGFTYSYPGFTPLYEVPEYTSGCYPHNCFIY